MSGAYPPLTCEDVKNILRKLGFAFFNKEGSHEQWKRRDSRGFFKVTVDCPKAPFTQDLISSMARQAGVTKKQFYATHRS